jgi:hypothetical protein
MRFDPLASTILDFPVSSQVFPLCLPADAAVSGRADAQPAAHARRLGADPRDGGARGGDRDLHHRLRAAALCRQPLVVCLLVGAIVATTDPSAVVGIFREIGAPRRLTRLIEGESLLNDAAAIALFGLFVALTLPCRGRPALQPMARLRLQLVWGGAATRSRASRGGDGLAARLPAGAGLAQPRAALHHLHRGRAGPFGLGRRRGRRGGHDAQPHRPGAAAAATTGPICATHGSFWRTGPARSSSSSPRCWCRACWTM